MTRYFAALLLIVCGLSFAAIAQDKSQKSGPCAPQTAGVSQITTFTMLVVNVVEDGVPVMSIKLEEDGSVACRHIVKTEKNGLTKTVTTEVETSLTPAEIKSIREAFARLELDTLKTRDLKEGEEPPTKFTVISATNGSVMARLAFETDKKELEVFAKVNPFMKAITKVADRLK